MHSAVEAHGNGESHKQASSPCNSSSKSDTNTHLSYAQKQNPNPNHKSSNHELEANPNPNPKPCNSFSGNDTSTSLSDSHDIIHTHDQNCGANPSPNPNPNPGSDFLEEEGQGECNVDHVNCEDTFNTATMVSSRKPSPAAATRFCKGTEEEEEYFQQILGSSSHGWTDEKHSSYLDSMEADFLRSVVFKGNVYTEPTDLADSASSQQAQFKVCQNGMWRPVCVQAPYVGPLKQLAVAVKNPWIKRFRPSKKTYFPSLITEDPLVGEATTHSSS
eukprot:c22402_g1_i1 orf=410-1231(-)